MLSVSKGLNIIFQETEMILALLASVLHITDIKFENDPESDGVFIKQEDIMEIGRHFCIRNYALSVAKNYNKVFSL